jgi:hypothetical protein
MTREDINIAIGENVVTTRHVTTAEVFNIMMYVHVNLELDRGTLEHYYSINVEELLNSQMPISDLDDLKSQGWAYDNTKENIIIWAIIIEEISPKILNGSLNTKSVWRTGCQSS